MKLSLLLIFVACFGGCSPSGLVKPSVFIVPSDQQVFLIEPNQPFSAPWPAAVLSRGEYMRLVEIDMQVKSGELVPRKE